MPDISAMVEEIKKLAEEGQKAHHDFKKTNDERIAKLEKSAGGISELKERMDKASEAVEKFDTLNQKLIALELAMKRSGTGNGPEVSTDEKYAEAVSKEFKTWARKADRGEFDISTVANREEFKALSVQSDPDGGYFVNPDMSGRMVKRVFERSPIRAYASVQAVSTDSLEGFFDIEDTEFENVTETQAGTNATTPQIGKWNIPTHEKVTRPKITQKLLEDAEFNVENWLADKIADKKARVEGRDALLGTGVGEMTGILTVPGGTAWKQFEDIETANSGVFDGDDLLNAIYALKAFYRSNGRLFMHRLTFREARKLKDNEGRYLWEPSWQAGQPANLIGFPVAEFDDLPSPTLAGVYTAGTYPILFADMAEAYQLVDRRGISVLRDPYTAKPFVEFYTRFRVGGAPLNFEALKRVKIKA